LNSFSFYDPIADDLERVESLLRQRPAGQHEAVGEIVGRLIGAGGKRLRPALVLLSAHLCGADLKRATFAAAAVEMLHTASLIHDDLIDDSSVRRGRETLNSHQPPGATVLVGDYLFAYAANLATKTGNTRFVQRFAETLMTICGGEIQQMFDGPSQQISRREYEQRILAKTASLVAISAQAGAILADADEGATETLRTYGEQLGLAFQIVDDVLDYAGNKEMLGKSVGSDLQHGIATLPLILFRELEPGHPSVLQALRESASEESVQKAVQAVRNSAAIERALDAANEHASRAQEALQAFPDSAFRQALLDLADFTVSRPF